MSIWRVFLAVGFEDIEADTVSVENNYFSKIEGQQPTVCFYKGNNPTMDNIVAEFVYKNISGYKKITQKELDK